MELVARCTATFFRAVMTSCSPKTRHSRSLSAIRIPPPQFAKASLRFVRSFPAKELNNNVISRLPYRRDGAGRLPLLVALTLTLESRRVLSARLLREFG